MASQTKSPTEITYLQPLQALPILERFTSVHPDLQGDERRRAVSLVWLTLVFMILGLLTIFSAPIADWVNGEAFVLPDLGSLLGVAMIAVSYFLSRTKNYEIGAYLTIAAPFVAVIAVTIASEDAVSEVALVYLTLGVILSSLLLNSRGTIIFGILAGLATVFAYFIANDAGTTFPWPVLMFGVLATGILAVTSRVRENYLEQLAHTQAELELRIAEATQARAEAERSNQVKSAFLASMSHELRTPLNAVINFTKFVAQGDMGPVNEEQEETLMEAVDSGRHLLNLINDVLDMSKIESGALNLFIRDSVNVNAVLDTTLKSAHALLQGKPVEIRTHIDPNLPLIRGDEQRIRQILLNILSNACKFTEQGYIDVEARQEGDMIHLSVTDTGPGIAAHDQQAVFNAFQQTSTGLRQGGGTGLGMPISKKLAEVHGGDLWLESQAGQGATFFVTLPIKSETLVPFEV